MSRSQDGSLAIANATFSPVESLSISRDGKLSITLKDSFNDSEKQFIAAWMKAKFVPRPASTGASTTTSTSTSTDTTTDDASTESATSAAPSATVAPSAIKVAIIKSKKLKATDENVSLVQDLMKEGGMTLDDAIKELASAS